MSKGTETMHYAACRKNALVLSSSCLAFTQSSSHTILLARVSGRMGPIKHATYVGPNSARLAPPFLLHSCTYYSYYLKQFHPHPHPDSLS